MLESVAKLLFSEWKGFIMSKFGRKAGAAIMAGLMGLGYVGGAVAVTSAPMVALAVNYGNGSITINQSSNDGAKYDGYRLFKGVVTTAEGKDSATDVVWEDDATKQAVLGYLQGSSNTAPVTYSAWLTNHGHTAAVNGVPAAEVAQNAADYISEMIGYSGDTNASATAAGTSTTPRTTDGRSFANGLARALVASNISAVTPQGGLATGTAWSGTQGYYLFSTHDETVSNTIGTDEAGTAPIWVALSGSGAKVIAEKSAVPTIDKKVIEDSTNAEGIWADANRNQDVSFVLTGTMPENIKAFNTYYYQFVDTMTNLEMSAADVSAATVKIGNTDITDKCTKTFSNGVFTVTCEDLITAFPGLTKDSVVKVEYKAHLNGNAVIGGTGNPNTVYLNYSSNPNKEATHTPTSEKTTRVFTYQLNFTKVDQDTREALKDAEFTIQVASTSTDNASKGKYLQADGSLGDTAYRFKSDANGQFSVPRIDEGVYTIREVTPAADHTAWNQDVTLTIGRTINANGELTGLNASVSGGNGLFVNGTAAAHQDGMGALIASSGVYPLTASDKKITYLPGTGLTTSAAGMLAGLACVIGGSVVVMSRKKKDGAEA